MRKQYVVFNYISLARDRMDENNMEENQFKIMREGII